MIVPETQKTPIPLSDVPQVLQRPSKNIEDDAPQAVEMTTC